MRKEQRELLGHLLDEHHSRTAIGCCLHAVVEDMELGDDSVVFCIHRAEKERHPVCLMLAQTLRAVPLVERVAMLDPHNVYYAADEEEEAPLNLLEVMSVRRTHILRTGPLVAHVRVAPTRATVTFAEVSYEERGRGHWRQFVRSLEDSTQELGFELHMENVANGSVAGWLTAAGYEEYDHPVHCRCFKKGDKT